MLSPPQLFPPRVARALASGKPVEPERYDCVSLFFSDIVGYTDICGQLAPHEVMDLLDRLYTAFDDAVRDLELFKVRRPPCCCCCCFASASALSAVAAVDDACVRWERCSGSKYTTAVPRSQR